MQPEFVILFCVILGIVGIYADLKETSMAGHTPPKPSSRVTAEEHHLMTAKICYATGSLTFEEFEKSVEHVLKGGTLTSSGRIPQFPVPVMTKL